MQLTSSLSALREQCRKLQVDHNFLKAREKELEARLKIGEDMILAMKGRANSSRKVEEQLRCKCTSLERALELANLRPTVCRVPIEKTRVELELIKECKKKVSSRRAISVAYFQNLYKRTCPHFEARSWDVFNTVDPCLSEGPNGHS